MSRPPVDDVARSCTWLLHIGGLCIVAAVVLATIAFGPSIAAFFG